MSSEDLIREAQDPATPPARLAELAQADRATWAAIVFNPSAYDGLLQWLGERGDPTVNAALTARASHAATQQPSTPQAPPVAPAPVVPVAEAPATPVDEPTAVMPTEPTPEPTPEPTVVIPTTTPAREPQPDWTQPAQPTSVFSSQSAAYPAAPAASTAAFGAVPPAGDEAKPTEGGGSGRPLAFVIAMVVVIIALIGGAAFGATQVFGGDDDDKITALNDKKTEAPEPSDDEPTVPAPDDATDDTDDAVPGASGEFCTTMKEIQDSSMDLLDNGGSTPDLDSIQQMAADMTAAYASLEDSAPDELKADIAVMGDYFDMLNNPAEAAEGLSESIADYSKAAQNVGIYYAQNCL